MSFWQKTMLWLGLGPDEMYEGMADSSPTRNWPGEYEKSDKEPSAAKVPIRARLKEGLIEDKSTSMDSTGTVRPLRAARSTQPKTEEPKNFNDVTGFADRYTSGNAVLVKLEGVEHAVARRIIDFASGLCYAEKGEMERMGNQEYLLIPKDATVDSDTREKIKEEINRSNQE
ncbi:MAG: cell division protein SepF [Actinomycetota bacterium]|nr:cell division protein SepF [Actinomycetota bacterium]MED5276911.1 cell division protein SepF [Actinomycetota bacterium]|tara:strand:+ start:1429 stop:1944 length:516 start_codon:yes stop_codon:yes gene_type:complete